MAPIYVIPWLTFSMIKIWVWLMFYLGLRAFTWEMSKIHRVFISGDLVDVFPKITFIVLDRKLLGHSSIILKSMTLNYCPMLFKLFYPMSLMVSRIW